MSSVKSSSKDKGWVNVKTSSSAKRRQRRKNKKRKDNDNNKSNVPKIVPTKPKHAAPPNASTIYCQWYQEGLCNRGKKCFFIHELDPMSEKNPIEHQAMIKQLLNSKNQDETDPDIKTQVSLKKPPKPRKIRSPSQNSDEFVLPSKNKAFQNQIQRSQPTYNRYSDFQANAMPNHQPNPPFTHNFHQPTLPQHVQPHTTPYHNAQYNHTQPTHYNNIQLNAAQYNNFNGCNNLQQMKEMMYAIDPPSASESPPNPYMYDYGVNYTQPNTGANYVSSNLNVTAHEFVPTNPQMKMPTTWTPNQVNPYLTPENAHTANPYAMSNAFPNNANATHVMDDEDAHKRDLMNEYMRDPTSFENKYEIWEDEHGEVIFVEKDQLYGDDPYRKEAQTVNSYNEDNMNMNPLSPNPQQRGLRSGGQTYNYGAIHSPNRSHHSKSQRRLRKQKIASNSNGARKLSGYSQIASKFSTMNIGHVESKENNSNPDYNASVKICQFWLHSHCLFGENCKMAHRFEDNKCVHCGKTVGKSPLIQQHHLKECASKLQLDREMKMSENIECGICQENVKGKNSKFGLLTGCTHGFCLKCIREWRGVLGQSKEAVRSCPICRKMTWFIVPSDRFVTDAKRKEEIIEKYKQRLGEIRCKHFDFDEECPFGSSCFYKHVRKDGSIDDKKVSLRHMINADGETEIMKQMKLSEFLFGPSGN